MGVMAKIVEDALADCDDVEAELKEVSVVLRNGLRVHDIERVEPVPVSVMRRGDDLLRLHTPTHTVTVREEAIDAVLAP